MNPIRYCTLARVRILNGTPGLWEFRIYKPVSPPSDDLPLCTYYPYANQEEKK
jgi:hypothetical protein